MKLMRVGQRLRLYIEYRCVSIPSGFALICCYDILYEVKIEMGV